MKRFTLSTASLLWALVSTQAVFALPEYDIVYTTVYECLAPGAGPFTVIPGIGPDVIATTIGAQPTSAASTENNKATPSQQNQTPAASQGASSVSGGRTTGVSGTESNGGKGPNDAVTASSSNGGDGVNGATSTSRSGAISSFSTGGTGGNGGTSVIGQTTSTSSGNLPYSTVYSFSNHSTSTSSLSSKSSTTLSTVSPSASSLVPDILLNLLSNGGFSDGLSGWDGSGNITTEQHGLPNTGNTGNVLLSAAGTGTGPLHRRQTTGTPATIFQTVQTLPSGSLTVVWLYYAVDMTVQAAGATPQNCKLDVSFGSILMVSSGYFPSTGVPYTALNSLPLVLVGTGPLTIAVNCINGGSVAVRVDEVTYGISSLVTTPANSSKDSALPSLSSVSSSLASVQSSSISSISSSTSRSLNTTATTSTRTSSSSTSRSSNTTATTSTRTSSSSTSRSSNSTSTTSTRTSSSSTLRSSNSTATASTRTSSSSNISSLRATSTVSTTSSLLSAPTTSSSAFTSALSSAPLCIATPAVDQLTNGNFNTGLLTPWTINLAPNSVASIKNSNNSEHSYVAVIDISHRPTDTNQGATTALQQVLTSLTPFTTYTISIDFNITVADPNVYLQVSIGPSFFKEFEISTYSTGTWHTVTTTYTTGSDTGGLGLSIFTTALGTSATQFQLDNIIMLAPAVVCDSAVASSSATSGSSSLPNSVSATSVQLAQTSTVAQPSVSSTTVLSTLEISTTSASATTTASPLCSAAPTGVQLLINPSFEQGTATTATNWTIGSYSEIETSSVAEDGAKAVLLRGFGLAGSSSPLIGAASQNLPCVDTCSQYTVNYYYNATWFQRAYYGAVPTTLVGALCQVRTLFNGVVLDSQPVTAASNGWVHVSLTFIPSASSGALVIQNYCTNGLFATVESKIDIDNISLVRQNVATCVASTSIAASTSIPSIVSSVTSKTNSNSTWAISSSVTPMSTATLSTSFTVTSSSSSTMSTITSTSASQCTTTTAAATSIINNGDFETGNITPWILSLGPKSSAFVTKAGDPLHNYALYANISHLLTDAAEGASSAMSQLITLTPSTTYQISIDYLIMRADANVYLGVQLGTTSIVDQIPATVAINTWQTITVAYTTGSTVIEQHISMIITALQDSSSSYFFDNIKIIGPTVGVVGPCVANISSTSSTTLLATSSIPSESIGTSISTTVVATMSSSSTSFAPATTSTACAIATSVAVTFNELRTTTFGQTVKIVGSIPSLGNWDTTSAVELNAYQYTSSNHLWSGIITLSAGVTFQYKLIVVDTSGFVTWEADPNRSYTVPTPTGCSVPSVTLAGSWQ